MFRFSLTCVSFIYYGFVWVLSHWFNGFYFFFLIGCTLLVCYSIFHIVFAYAKSIKKKNKTKNREWIMQWSLKFIPAVNVCWYIKWVCVLFLVSLILFRFYFHFHHRYFFVVWLCVIYHHLIYLYINMC